MASASQVIGFRNISLTAKLLVVCTAVVLLAVGVGTTTLTWWSGRQAHEAALTEGKQLALRHAADIERQLDAVVTVADTLRGAILSLKRAGAVDRAVVDRMLQDALADHPDYLGVWAGFEPDALDGRDAAFAGTPGTDASGRFLSYWNRGGGAIQREALVDYDTAGAGDYYQIVKKTGKPALLEPYLYAVAGKDMLITSISVPVLDNGRFLGVAGVDIALDGLSDRLKRVRPFGTGAIYLISNAGNWVAFDDPAALGKPIEKSNPTLAAARDAIRGGQPFAMEAFSKVQQATVQRLFVPVTIADSGTPWSLLLAMPMAQAEAAAAEVRNGMMAGGAVALLALVGTLALAAHVVLKRPLARSITAVRALADGDLVVTIPDAERGDEIGAINRALDRFKQNAVAVRRLEHARAVPVGPRVRPAHRAEQLALNQRGRQ